MNIWVEAILWAGAVIIGIFSFIANYAAISEWWNKITTNKNAQPKLAISVSNFSRSQFRANAVIYHPFDLAEGEAITFDQQKLLSYDYDLTWNITFNITNNSDITAYQIKVIHTDTMTELVVNPKIDYTIPIKPSETKVHDFIFRRSRRAKSEEAAAILKANPFTTLRIEYYNLAGTKFATDFLINEKFDEKKNAFLKVIDRENAQTK